MKIGDTQDVNKYQEMSHIDSQVLMAFFLGHIITKGGEDYRFARKDQELYEEGDQVFVATEEGVYFRTFSFANIAPEFTKEHATGFRWMNIWGDSMTVLLGIIKKMTKREKLEAIANLAFDNVQNKRDEKAA